MARRLLVTGGAGFVGANFVRFWLGRHEQDRVVVLDALTYAGNLVSLAGLSGKPEYRFVHGDIRDRALVRSLLAAEGIDIIVHFAAESHVDRSIPDPNTFVDTNIVGTHNLLEAARAEWLTPTGAARAGRFHHVSTDEVYGSLGSADPPFTELARYNPSSPYAASKAAADHLVRAYCETYGLQTSISNCSNNYGRFHLPEKLIPLAIVNVLQNKAVPVYGDGSNIRDWLHVEDHCRGIEMILDRGTVGESYNIGANNEWSNIDIVSSICRLLDEAFGRDSELERRFPGAAPAKGRRCCELITFVADRPGHDFRYAIDASKSARELGFGAFESFEQGLSKTVQWYLDHEDWWRSVLDPPSR